MRATACVIAISCLCACAATAISDDASKTTAGSKLSRLSGPYAHGNLTLFLVHGFDRIPGANFLTLREALEQKVVVVHETSQVEELSIENTSKTWTVFVQSGEIVKGGKQDRTIARDMLLPPKSGVVPLPSHCVENGRWQQRGAEASQVFSKSEDYLAGKDLKLANAVHPDQRKVWASVEAVQGKLNSNVKSSVQSASSPSSFQLSLEHPKVIEAIDAHVRLLAPIVGEKADVVGYVFAINGKLNSAEVYGSSALFRKLWPKLLKSSAVEAVAEETQGAKAAPVTTAVAAAFLDDADRVSLTERKAAADPNGPAAENGSVNQAVGQNAVRQVRRPPAVDKTDYRLRLMQGETAKVNIVESRDREAQDAWIHRSSYAKEAAKAK